MPQPLLIRSCTETTVRTESNTEAHLKNSDGPPRQGALH